jgi:DNA-binding NarL/FixJ family response regulator
VTATVAIVNDYELVVRGLAAMLEPYSDRVRLVDLEAGGEPKVHADVALFDTFGGRKHALARAKTMLEEGFVDQVVLYTWDANAPFLDDAERIGVAAVISKTVTAAELVDAIERVVDGEGPTLRLTPSTRGGRDQSTGHRERSEVDMLSAREREVLALLALGLTNRAIGEELYLSTDTVKTYVRRVYAKLGVRNRAQAATRATRLGLHPPETRLAG